MRKPGPSFPMITVILMATLLLSARAMGQPGEMPLTKKSSQITYIEIGISQPNVEECYATTNIENPANKNWLAVFPNPGRGVFNLEINLTEKSSSVFITVYDITGKTVFSHKENQPDRSHTLQLNLSFLEKGIYILRVNDSSNAVFDIKRLLIY